MSRVARPSNLANSLISLRGTDCVSICEMHSHTHTHTHMNLYVHLCINKTQNVPISRGSRLFHMFPTYFTLFMQFVVWGREGGIFGSINPAEYPLFLVVEWGLAEVS